VVEELGLVCRQVDIDRAVVRAPLPVLRIAELRRRTPQGGVGTEPQVLVEAGRGDDLARVHLSVGVPDSLELAERLDELLPELLRQQLGTLLAVAVLARQRAAVRHDEIGRLFEERAVDSQPSRVRRSKSMRECMQP
jgi:hypothetical protein